MDAQGIKHVMIAAVAIAADRNAVSKKNSARFRSPFSGRLRPIEMTPGHLLAGVKVDAHHHSAVLSFRLGPSEYSCANKHRASELADFSSAARGSLLTWCQSQPGQPYPSSQTGQTCGIEGSPWTSGHLSMCYRLR